MLPVGSRSSSEATATTTSRATPTRRTRTGRCRGDELTINWGQYGTYVMKFTSETTAEGSLKGKPADWRRMKPRPRPGHAVAPPARAATTTTTTSE